MQSRRSPRRRTLVEPLGFAASQTEECVDGAPVAQLQPTPFDWTGALSLEQRPCDRSGDPASLGEPAFVTLGYGERDIDAGLHQVQPAQLPVSHSVLPCPVPGRAHVADLLADSWNAKQ